ncbi:MAG TPA: hypothetical protein VGL92_11735 [Acidimicrobiia bacterium]|jgi:hypothetical protein
MTEVIRLAVTACPHTPGHEMSPAAAMTGSEPLGGAGEVVGLGGAVVPGEVVLGAVVGIGEIEGIVGIGESEGLGEAVGLGAPVVPVVLEGVGTGVWQCGLRGFGRWQGAPWTVVGEPRDTTAATASTASVPPTISRMILFGRRCRPLRGVGMDIGTPPVRRRG